MGVKTSLATVTAIALAPATILALPALAECEEGETVTITETIADVRLSGLEDTYIELVEKDDWCSFEYIFFPKGAHVPDTCRKGKLVTATGTKEEGAVTYGLVDVQSISCK